MKATIDAARRQRWAKAAPEVEAALAYHRAGRLDKAEVLYRKILNRVPDHPDAMHMLGAIATGRSRPERAIQLIGKVLEIFPNAAEAHFNLGNAYVAAGKRPDAIASYRRAIASKPDYALAYSSLGREQSKERDFVGALASCRRGIQLDPTLADSHLNLGIALWNLGRLAEAEAAFRETLRLNPGHVYALGYLAQVLIEYSRFEDARRCQEQILALQPTDALAHRALAMSEFRTGDTAASLERFRHAVGLDPDYAEGWTSLGWALRALGRFDEAVICLRRALAINPDLAEARRMLAATGQQSADKVEMDRLRDLLSKPDLEVNDRVAAGFTLGSLLDRVDDYDEAFACFAAANSLARQALIAAARGYDTGAFERRIDDLIETFTPQFFAAVAAGGVASELPVFIVGMPRSGTTLVEQIAASHSRVFGAGELTDIGRLAQSLPLADAGPPDRGTLGRGRATACRSPPRFSRQARRRRRPGYRQAAGQFVQSGDDRRAVSGEPHHPVPARSARHLPVELFPVIRRRQPVFLRPCGVRSPSSTGRAAGRALAPRAADLHAGNRL